MNKDFLKTVNKFDTEAKNTSKIDTWGYRVAYLAIGVGLSMCLGYTILTWTINDVFEKIATIDTSILSQIKDDW